MRSIINISVPPELDRIIRTEMKKNHFATKSEFLRHILRDWMAAKLAKELEEGREEYRQGKTKKLNVEDLWK